MTLTKVTPNPNTRELRASTNKTFLIMKKSDAPNDLIASISPLSTSFSDCSTILLT